MGAVLGLVSVGEFVECLGHPLVGRGVKLIEGWMCEHSLSPQ